MTTNAAFARNLKALREERGLTQTDLALKLGLRPQTVSQWEVKNLSPRNKEVINHLCSFFGVTDVDLFGFADGYYARRYGLYGSVKASPMPVIMLEDEAVPIPVPILEKYPEGFVMRMADISMQLEIPQGTTIYVSSDPCEPDGSIYVLSLDCANIVRHVKKYDELYVLEPASAATQFKREFIDVADADRFKILGHVVWMQREF